MNRETYFVFDYFLRHPEFLESIKSLSFVDMIRYMKKNLDLTEDNDLTQIQVNLFYAAINNVDWHEVISELENKTTIMDVPKNEKI